MKHVVQAVLALLNDVVHDGVRAADVIVVSSIADELMHSGVLSFQDGQLMIGTWNASARQRFQIHQQATTYVSTCDAQQQGVC